MEVDEAGKGKGEERRLLSTDNRHVKAYRKN
jgi:hypothetical protein